MRNLAFLIALFIFNTVNAQDYTEHYQLRYGGSGFDDLTSITSTVDGGYIVGGKSNSDISGEKLDTSRNDQFNWSDYWLVKFNALGNEEWQKTIGGDNRESFSTVIQTSDGGFLTAGSSASNASGDKTENHVGFSFNYDYWLVKLDAFGNIQWQNTIGSFSDDYVDDIVQTNDGNFIIIGSTNGDSGGDKSENSRGSLDLWMVKVNSAGQIIWEKTIGGSGVDLPTSIINTSDGGFAISALSYSPISGEKTEDGQGESDFWVIKCNALGAIEWQNTIGGSSFDMATDIEQLTDGSFVVGGRSQSSISGDKATDNYGLASTYDFWLLKLDALGNIVSQNSYGGSFDDYSSGITLLPNDELILFGNSVSQPSGNKTSAYYGGKDFWALKIDASNNILWQYSFGGTDSDELNACALLNDGSLVLAGSTLSGLSGTITDTSRGNSDYQIVKLIPPQRTWNGQTSVEWENGSNWSYAIVPDSTNEITISQLSSGFYPHTNSDITVSNLTVNSNASLDIGEGFGLIITQDGVVNNSGEIRLNANSSGTAFIDDFTNINATYNGDLTVEQHVQNDVQLGQHYFGSPVQNAPVVNLAQVYLNYPLGQLISGDCLTNTLDPFSPYSNLMEWDEADVFACSIEGWTAINQNMNLDVCRGYSGWMYGGYEIEFTGPPNTELSVLPFGPVVPSSAATLNSHGWYLISNPFPSPLSIDALFEGSIPFSSPTYFDAATGTYQPILPGENLAIAQGFFAEAGVFGSEFLPQNLYRRRGNLNLKSDEEDYEVQIEITVNVNGNIDITRLYTNESASTDFDIVWDRKKRFSEFGKPTLFTDLAANPMSLNVLSTTDLNGSIPLGLMPGEDAEHTLSFEGNSSLPDNIRINLVDHKTGIELDLSQHSSYTFQANLTDDADRFELIFEKDLEQNPTSINDATTPKEELFYANGNQLFVGLGSMNENETSKIEIFNSAGQLLKVLENIEHKETYTLNGIHGVCILRLVNGSHKVTKKVVFD